MVYMFCYDISNPKRLYKVSKILEKYGLRVQKSFFQCNINPELVDKIKNDVFKVIDAKSDSFFIYPMCERCAQSVTTLGTGVLLNIEPFEIL